ncbi:MAG TPA: 50S ribosomal protein L25 [Armatimonadota bacterium]|nr:50S ribosomal protein L25 [Armatimonadota bacterium]
MEQRELAVTKREQAGTSAARRLRRQGLAPAVLYGRGRAPVALAVNAKRLLEVLRAGGHNAVVRLEVENGGEEPPTVMLREIQVHPLTGQVLNVDFQRISLTEKITAQVPVVVIGEAPGLKQGGVLDHVLREVEVVALPTELPNRIELDISKLEIGHALHVSDLSLPSEVTLVSEASGMVVSMTLPRAVEEVAPAAPTEAPEGEEAPAAGEAPAEEEDAGADEGAPR